MEEELSLAHGERNLARPKVREGAVDNLNFISRPKAGQHAFPEDAQANGIVLGMAQDVGQQSCMVRSWIRFERTGHPRVQEVFFENWHWPTVEMTLPQDRASVSKTRSWRNAGLR
jgi:hypothetical protein